jgi:single-strand DNA-binding protein
MANYNKVLLMGRLTRDPEVRYTPQGVPVLELGLAVNREYLAGNERRKETTFLEVTFWRRQAEVISQYLKKGAPIFVEGRLALDNWETPDGQKRSRLRVVGDNFQFMSSRGEGEGASTSGAEEGGGAPQGYRRRTEPDESSRGGQGARPGPKDSRPTPPVPEPFEEVPEEEPPQGGPLGLEDKDVPF